MPVWGPGNVILKHLRDGERMDFLAIARSMKHQIIFTTSIPQEYYKDDWMSFGEQD
jgi:hypothetical protein